MKVSLQVASGAHQGKMIPITGQQFLIGRDPQCHLRPASQAISKRHCGILIRDGKVYVRDYGSTNGTVVNDEVIRDSEVAVESGASVKIGPLDFLIQIEQTAIPPDGTPLPSTNPETAAALAAVTAAVAATPKDPARDTTPNPAAPKSATPPAKPAPSTDAEHDEHMAAMLLGMDEDGTGEVPDGSTVMEIPTPEQLKQAGEAKAEDPNKKKVISREDMTNAASDILRKMMRRPK